MNLENIYWLGHASFRIEDRDRQIYIDPWKLSSGLPKADFIFITHEHYDHYSAKDIALIKKDETVIIGTLDVAEKHPSEVVGVKPGETRTVNGLTFSTEPAYNLNKSFHPKANGWVGYKIELSTRLKVYHTGDTDFIPEMKNVQTDILMLPIGGTYTMTAVEAAQACEAIQPKGIIPMHWGDIVGSADDVEVLKQHTKLPIYIKQPHK